MTISRQALLNALDGVCYLTTPEGRILEVGEPAWSESLRQYGGRSGDGETIVGRNLFDMMHGEEVRAAYRAVHAAILGGSRSYVAFEMRCDGPDARQLMRMSVSALREPAEPLAVLYQSQILSAISRPWMSLFDPQKIVEHIRRDGGLPIVRVCSFCFRVAWPPQDPDRWIDGEDYYRLGAPTEVRVSHGVCGECGDRVAPRSAVAELADEAGR